ncbi:hypothetical protein OG689_42085 [Kitasatospora sp. NBC_00240]|uniref:hypothetical protein n=1 Tax=Kitasatospora sp. NBC_00240 TaxID=2903567 RepID=UPI00225AA895|nr:hypothetical protein [Kitasatospora sp. NBC_00240]MCX5215747.1 hypothetical protein [Kitasatospora sp. NBC_00240]
MHHFKWRRGVQDDVRCRAEHFAAGAWKSLSQVRHTEAAGCSPTWSGTAAGSAAGSWACGRSPSPRTPAWWAEERQHLVDTWRPPARVFG